MANEVAAIEQEDIAKQAYGNLAGNRWIQLVCGVVAMTVISNYQYAFTLFTPGIRQSFPGVPYANSVRHLPQDIEKLYEEARSAIGSGAPTAAVLACRTLLMHVAVEKGAKEGENFLSYVTYLAEKNFIPAGASAWVDKIRTKGNEANHQIVIKTREEAEEMIEFSEMLLKVVYEYPARA